MSVIDRDFSVKLSAIAKYFNPTEDVLTSSFDIVQGNSQRKRVIKSSERQSETHLKMLNVLFDLNSNIKYLNNALRDLTPYEQYSKIARRDLPSSQDMELLKQKVDVLKTRIIGNGKDSISSLPFEYISKSILDLKNKLKNAEDIYNDEVGSKVSKEISQIMQPHLAENQRKKTPNNDDFIEVKCALDEPELWVSSQSTGFSETRSFPQQPVDVANSKETNPLKSKSKLPDVGPLIPISKIDLNAILEETRRNQAESSSAVQSKPISALPDPNDILEEIRRNRAESSVSVPPQPELD